MSSSAPVRSAADVARHVAARCIRPGPPGTVGVEVEWHVVDRGTPERRVPIDELSDVVAPTLPLGGRSTVTYEPGGQLELSSAPAPDVGTCCAALEADVSSVSDALAAHDLALVGLGTDPVRAPRRVLSSARYDAMEAYFDSRGRTGHTGRTMMCSTAAVQVNIDAGPAVEGPGGFAARWASAHSLGPVLVAAFANSPLLGGRPTGWQSTRQAVWARLDPSRTRPPGGGHPVAAWTAYALGAGVMLVRDGAGGYVGAPAPMTFAEWVGARSALRPPTFDDLDDHLTTLFPPVRPRGWFELRMVDSLPSPWWQVVAAVVAALLDDPLGAERAARATAPVAGLWEPAARYGLAHPALAAAAVACFDAALEALPRIGGAALVDVVSAYADRYVCRGRSPAHDALLAASLDSAPAALFALSPPAPRAARARQEVS